MPSDFKGLVEFAIEFLNLGVTAFLSLAFLVLIWKMIDAWVIHADDPTKREEGTTMAITAVVVIVIMVSIWGILSLLTGR
jgi:hypothetical protein